MGELKWRLLSDRLGVAYESQALAFCLLVVLPPNSGVWEVSTFTWGRLSERKGIPLFLAFPPHLWRRQLGLFL